MVCDRLLAQARIQTFVLAVIAAAGLFFSITAQAFDVGHSRVISSPGQPLVVDVPLRNVTLQEAQSLQIALAPASAWQAAGLTPPVALTQLQVSVQAGTIATSRVVRVSSASASEETVINLLLDVATDTGRRVIQTSVIVLPPPTIRVASDQTVTVMRGDTLIGIANKFPVAGATLYQTLWALYQANPSAFISENMNLLKAGAALNIPDAAAVRAIDPAFARARYLAHVQTFQRMRGSGAAVPAQAADAAQAPAAPSTPDRGQVEPVPSAVAPLTQDQVQLSSAPMDMAADQRISEARAQAEERDRAQALERNIEALKSVAAAAGTTGDSSTANRSNNVTSAATDTTGAIGDTTTDAPSVTATASITTEAATDTNTATATATDTDTDTDTAVRSATSAGSTTSAADPADVASNAMSAASADAQGSAAALTQGTSVNGQTGISGVQTPEQIGQTAPAPAPAAAAGNAANVLSGSASIDTPIGASSTVGGGTTTDPITSITSDPAAPVSATDGSAGMAADAGITASGGAPAAATQTQSPEVTTGATISAPVSATDGSAGMAADAGITASGGAPAAATQTQSPEVTTGTTISAGSAVQGAGPASVESDSAEPAQDAVSQAIAWVSNNVAASIAIVLALFALILAWALRITGRQTKAEMVAGHKDPQQIFKDKLQEIDLSLDDPIPSEPIAPTDAAESAESAESAKAAKAADTAEAAKSPTAKPDSSA